jgi:hypothetical protein
MNYFPLQTAYGVFNILTNFLVWLAPLKTIWQVRLPREQKYSIVECSRWALCEVFFPSSVGVTDGE